MGSQAMQAPHPRYSRTTYSVGARVLRKGWLAPVGASLPAPAAAFTEMAAHPDFPRLPGTPELKPHAPAEAGSPGAPTFSYATMAKTAVSNETLATQPSLSATSD